MKSVVKAYVYSHFHIGICTFVLWMFSMNMFDITLDYHYGVFLFCGTIAAYSLHRIIPFFIERNHLSYTRRDIYYDKLGLLIGGVIIALVMGFIAWLNLSYSNKIGSILASVITICYMLPIFGRSRLRDLNYIKIFLIAITWSMLTVSIPAVNYGLNLLLVMIFTMERVLYFVAITIPFDIRDMSVDKDQDLMTIPSLLGWDRAKIIAYGCLLLSSILVLIGSYIFHIPWKFTLAILLTYMISAILIRYTTSERSDLYYSGLIDGTMLLPYVFLGIFSLWL